MGTTPKRGIFALYFKGKYYWLYNHWDSWDVWANLQEEVTTAIADGTFVTWIDMFNCCKVVNDDIPVTVEDIARLSKYTDLSVSSQSTADWYCLTRRLQGTFLETLVSGYLYCTTVTTEPETTPYCDVVGWLDLETGQLTQQAERVIHEQSSMQLDDCISEPEV